MKTKKGKAAVTLAKSIQIGIIVTLLLMVVITSVYFIVRFAKLPRFPSKSREIPQQKIERVEQVVHVEVKGEKGNFFLEAKRHYMGKDNNYHLEGRVEIIDFGKEKSENIYISGEKVVYDKDMNHFIMKGATTIEYKDWIIKSDYFDYDKTKEEVTSNKGVTFLSRRLQGTAQNMFHSMRKDTIKLREKVRLELPQGSKEALPLVVKADSLDYYRIEREGDVLGEVSLIQGENHARANIMKFSLSKDEEYVESVFLKEKVKVNLVEEIKKEGSSELQNPLYGASGKREIEADEMHLQSFENFTKASRIKATGNCLYKSFDESGNFVQINGESLDILFNREGELKSFRAFNNVRIIENEEDSGERRYLEGEEMEMVAKFNTLKIRGKNGIGAKVTSQESEIVADEIILYLEDNDLEAKRRIKVIFKSKEEGESVGYFSKEQPVFIIPQEMRYDGSEKRFIFKRDIRVWQEKQMLLCDEFTLFEEREGIICSGDVKATFFRTLGEKKREEKIEVSADMMNFNPEDNIIFFEKNASLKVRDVNLRAYSALVHLKDEMKMIVTQGKVKITGEGLEGRAEEARFDLEKEAIIFTGKPVVVNKPRGVASGDKLTFYMGDGRIVVENEGRERSVTVIKS